MFCSVFHHNGAYVELENRNLEQNRAMSNFIETEGEKTGDTTVKKEKGGEAGG